MTFERGEQKKTQRKCVFVWSPARVTVFFGSPPRSRRGEIAKNTENFLTIPEYKSSGDH